MPSVGTGNRVAALFTVRARPCVRPRSRTMHGSVVSSSPCRIPSLSGRRNTPGALGTHGVSNRYLAFQHSPTLWNPNVESFTDNASPEKDVQLRFDVSKSEELWVAETSRLLRWDAPSPTWTGREITQAEETIRYWITKHRTRPQTIQTCLTLFGRTVTTLELHPQLLKKDECLAHWYDGRYPRATHLLNAIVDAWRLCWMDNANVVSAKQLFSLLESWTAAAPPVPIDARTYTLLLTAATAKGDPTQAPLSGQELLAIMLERGATQQAELPDTFLFTATLRAWALSGREDAAQGAWALWKDWRELRREGTVTATPNVVAYTTLLDVLTAAEDLVYMQHADQVLRDMMGHLHETVTPDTIAFRLVIFGWLRWAGKMPVALHADDEESPKRESCLVDARDENDPVSVPLQKAYGLLHTMLELDQSGIEGVACDATFFSKFISASALVGRFEIAQKAYDDLLALYEKTGQERFRPEIFTKRAMILVHCGVHRAVSAEKLLIEMQEEAAARGDPSFLPKPSHYRDVIMAWLTHPRDTRISQRAEGVLLRLIELASSMEDEQEKDRYMPNEMLIEKVLLSWSRSERQDAAFRAEVLLRTIQKLVPNAESSVLGPNAFANVMVAWSRSKSHEAVGRCEDLLFELQRRYEDGLVHLQPDAFHYTAVIRTWANSQRRDSASNIQDWFDQAVESYQAGNQRARPDQHMYGAAIHGFGHVGDDHKAERLFHVMIKDFEHGNESALPSTRILNMVLFALLRSSDTAAPERALKILGEIEALSRVGWFNAFPDDRSLSLAIQILSKDPTGKYTNEITDFHDQRKRLGKFSRQRRS